MTPRAIRWFLALLYLAHVRAGLAAGEKRDAIAADVCDLARRCGAVLDGAA